MKSSSTLHVYDTLYKLLRASSWKDIRHCKTLVWMIIGAVCSGCISLSTWADYSHGRAKQASSRVRRFARWLANDKIEVSKVYGAIIQEALASWGEYTLYLALDTSQLPGGYCLIRVSVLYRGRAVPVVWKVLAHESSSVALEVYRPLLEEAARLMPSKVKVVLLADRGFCDTKLMAYLDELCWHYRIRIKANLLCYFQGKRIKLSRVSLASGEACFWKDVRLTAKRYGPVHLALGRPCGSQLTWLVVSSEPTSSSTFLEYGLRFRLEEEFLDEKSNGFQLEDTRLQGAAVLNRLCLVLAVATLYLVAQGSELVHQGRRREVDPHSQRGSSYLKLGWRYLRRFLSGVAGYPLLTRLCLTGAPDPEPAMASKTQHAKHQRPRFDLLDFSSPETLPRFPAALALAA
jgi:hypothetical protein